jgi:hypothetical protein
MTDRELMPVPIEAEVSAAMFMRPKTSAALLATPFGLIAYIGAATGYIGGDVTPLWWDAVGGWLAGFMVMYMLLGRPY